MQSASKFPVVIQNKIENGEVVKIHGNEKEIGTRYYIHSRNTADALLHIINLGAHLHNSGCLDEPKRYNIVGDKCVSNLELAQTIAKLMGKELKYELVDFHKDNPAHDIHYGLDGTKLKNTGWKSPVSFEEGLKNTIEWQVKNKDWVV
jgi:dTDP-glucose 4,6-dehydratase